MNKKSQNYLRKGACQIAIDLIEQAEWENELAWQTLRPNREKKIEWQYSEDLYNGVAGIILFLLEISSYSENQYLEAAETSFHNLVEYCSKNPTTNYAFYTGRMGVSFVAHRFFEITGKHKYLEIAFELAKNVNSFLTFSPSNDLLNGTAGTLLGLLHLHATSDKHDRSQLVWIEDSINTYVVYLLSKSKVWRQGLYWDKSPQQIQGLCGFTHGAAGIGFVLLEVARYFDIKPLEYIAEQAFFYESLHYSEFNNNWADLRKRLFKDGEIDPDHEIQFIKQQQEYFTQGGDINAWCNGAVGIGLSRLRAYSILGEPIYKLEAENAIKKTIETTVNSITTHHSFALCHAAGGDADFLIYAAKVLGNQQLLEYAEAIGDKALQVKQSTLPYISCFRPAGQIEDRSLFVGNAGIGYFMLRLLDPNNVPSITMPFVNHKPTSRGIVSSFADSLPRLRKQVIAKQYPRTITLLETIASTLLESYFTHTLRNNRINEQEEFCSFLQRFIFPALEEMNRLLVEDIFMLENSKVALENSIESTFYLFIKQAVQSKKLKEINKENENSLLKALIAIDLDTQLLTTRYKWKNSIDSSYQLSNKQSFYLLQATPLGVVEIGITAFTATIIEVFTLHSMTVAESIDEIILSINFSSKEEKTHIRKAIIDQIYELIVAGILYVP